MCLASVLAACGASNDKKAEVHQTLTSAKRQASGCKQVKAPGPKAPVRAKKPKGELDSNRKWELTVDTNCGSLTIALDVEHAPRTSSSLVALAKSGFYDGTAFHRIVPGFVIQGGDPTGTGKGGPGYTTVDKPPVSARYTRGVVAMAKTQSEAAGTSGSQFFVVTGADTGLPPDYAVVGRVTRGIDVVQRVGQLGDPSSERPTQPVVISRIVVHQG
jgi:cyclophilin family peptidyl-prolyl cis-trans isomerase